MLGQTSHVRRRLLNWKHQSLPQLSGEALVRTTLREGAWEVAGVETLKRLRVNVDELPSAVADANVL